MSGNNQNNTGLKWFLKQRILIEGIWLNCKKVPRYQFNTNAALKLLKYMAILEVSLELVVLSFFAGMFRGNAIDESYIMVLKLTFLIFLMRTAINICTILASCKKVPALYYPEYAFKFILNWVILITLAGGIATFCVTTMIHYFIDVKISTIFFGLSVLSILALIGFVRFMEFSYNLLDAARKHLEVIQAATPAVVYSVENVD